MGAVHEFLSRGEIGGFVTPRYSACAPAQLSGIAFTCIGLGVGATSAEPLPPCQLGPHPARPTCPSPAQLEHLQAKYVGTGHADTNRFEWNLNIKRDT